MDKTLWVENFWGRFVRDGFHRGVKICWGGDFPLGKICLEEDFFRGDQLRGSFFDEIHLVVFFLEPPTKSFRCSLPYNLILALRTFIDVTSPHPHGNNKPHKFKPPKTLSNNSCTHSNSQTHSTLHLLIS